MKFTVEIVLDQGEMSSPTHVLECLKRSRALGTLDTSPFAIGECGKLYDAQGKPVGIWKVE